MTTCRWAIYIDRAPFDSPAFLAFVEAPTKDAAIAEAERTYPGLDLLAHRSSQPRETPLTNLHSEIPTS